MRFAFLALFVLTACTLAPETPKEQLTLKLSSFDALEGWQQDDVASALQAFRKSCAVLADEKNRAALVSAHFDDWQEVCLAATTVPLMDVSARIYFETWFYPYEVSKDDNASGLFTGYYTPELRGSLTRDASYQTPLYASPADKVDVDLGLFKADLKGQHIVGKVDTKNLIPYDNREKIAKGSLTNRADVLVWVDDPLSAFFLEIQGSGLVRLPDHSVLPVGYDGTNGQAYVAIGRVLAERGYIERPVTMPAILGWLEAHPDQAQNILNTNPAYVFFRRLPSEDMIGAEGVALTPGRSLAIDSAFLPLGVPLFLDTKDAENHPLQRLMIAQDRGGAIKGVVRGDFYWGTGGEAAHEAGAMQSEGRYYVLLPKRIDPNDH